MGRVQWLGEPEPVMTSKEISDEIARQPNSEFPWNVQSGSTAALQRQLNIKLAERGYCPIDADGVLGPGTCGAAHTLGIKVPPPCKSFEDPKRCDGSGGAKKSRRFPTVLGLGLAVLAVIGVVAVSEGASR